MSTTETFDTVGEETWTVPDRVIQVHIDAHGAQGGRGGGEGGFVAGTLDVSPGETLTIRVGGQGGVPAGGYNGGGDGGEDQTGSGGDFQGGGGGASDVRQGGSTNSDRVIVGAGGGGDTAQAGGGGAGGAAEGQGATSGETPRPTGGTQSSGGDGGSIDGEASNDGQDGGFNSGGDGGDSPDEFSYGGAGAGSGWYGGGGGAGYDTFENEAEGGAGGSNYVGGVTDTTSLRGGNTGDGVVVLEYTPTPEAPSNVTATVTGSNDILVEWTDGADTDSVEIYRGTQSGVDTSGSPIATVAAGVEEFTDTAVNEGTTYYYRLVATNDGGSSEDSTEVDATTVGPAPTDVGLSVFDNDRWDATWTLNSEDEAEVRVRIEVGESGVWETDATLAAGAESHSKVDALDGEWYRARIVAVFPDVETESEPSDPIVTDLPGVENLEAEDPNVGD